MEIGLKIRAWDSIGKIMLDWNTIIQTAFNREGELGLLYRIMTYPFNQNTIIPLLFSNLYDKNKKEIYAGDILAYKNSDCFDYQEDLDYEAFKDKIIYAVIQWDENLAGFRLKSESRFTVTRDILEVVGNIYENPELLNNLCS